MPLTEMGTIHADLVDPLPYWDRQTSLRELPAEAVDALVGAVGPDSGCELLHVELRRIEGAHGGEPAVPSGVPNALPMRDVPYYVFGFGVGPAERQDLLTGQLEGFVKALERWSSPHLVATFLSPRRPPLRRPCGRDDRCGEVRAARRGREHLRPRESPVRVNHNVRPL